MNIGNLSGNSADAAVFFIESIFFGTIDRSRMIPLGMANND